MSDLTGGTLSRIVPRHTRSETFAWCRREFMLFSTFKTARERNGMKVQKGCFWCRTPFGDNDMLALAGRHKAANVLICQKCAALLGHTDNSRPAKEK